MNRFCMFFIAQMLIKPFLLLYELLKKIYLISFYPSWELDMILLFDVINWGSLLFISANKRKLIKNYKINPIILVYC